MMLRIWKNIGATHATPSRKYTLKQNQMKMTYLMKRMTMLTVIMILMSCSNLCLNISPHPIVDYERIKQVIAFYETSDRPDNYSVVNSFGYLGKYQFHH